MKLIIGCVLIIGSLTTGTACAQFGVPWRHTPTIAVISAEGDARLSLVDEAVSFWNKTLEEIGSGFSWAASRASCSRSQRTRCRR